STPHDCSGTARCITGTVTSVIDGDTIKIDGQSIRFALASAPEINEFGGDTARNFIDEICPVGSTATVDEDDEQTEGSYGRIVGVIYCNGMNLNEELLDADLGYLELRFCDKSEFSTQSWAKKHGCVQATINDCDPSYPDFCIPSPPPDLDCGDIPQKRFTVLQPDPHRFDGDKDGIGCES
ncbi:MAG: thermonuclease family protein, partial [Thaumarchaeota archaeon]|nr:thermonuclease family protein [Nitrososphaerota archaeon]